MARSRDNIPFIGKKLREIRESKRMSLSELSRLADIPIGSLGDIERGRALNPAFYTVVKVCRALGVSPLILIDDGNPISQPEINIDDIKYLYDIDYLKLFKDPKFREYFNVTKNAYINKVSPDVLNGLVNVLATHSRVQKNQK